MCIEFQHLSCQVLATKRLAYLLTYFIAVDDAVAWNQLSRAYCLNSENDSKLKDCINFGIYWKNLFSHSQPWPLVCGLGLACLWSWLTGLGLDTNIPATRQKRSFWKRSSQPFSWHSTEELNLTQHKQTCIRKNILNIYKKRVCVPVSLLLMHGTVLSRSGPNLVCGILTSLYLLNSHVRGVSEHRSSPRAHATHTVGTLLQLTADRRHLTSGGAKLAPLGNFRTIRLKPQRIECHKREVRSSAIGTKME